MSVWNMTARLTMESSAFERNSKRAGQSLRSIANESRRAQQHLNRMIHTGLAMAGLGGGIYGVVRMMKGLVAAAQKQEDAERALAGALRATGDEVESNMDRLKDYASQIQRLTTHGDEEVLQQMAYARNLGVTSDALADVTKGASGLATALNLDLATAMRYTSTALQGDFTILRRYIPELRSTSDAGEQLAIVQRKMAEGWQQSQERARTSTGQIQQARNRIGDVAEAIGVELLPTMAAGFQKLAEFLETNQDDFAAWAKGIIGIMGTIGKGFSWIDRMRAGASGVLERQAGQSVIAEQARQRYLLEQPQDKAYFDWFADQKKAVAFGGVGAVMAMKDREVPTLTDPGRLAVIQNQLRRENDVVVQERERLARELESKRQTIGGQYDPLDLSKIGAKGGDGAAAETVKSTDDITAAMARMYDQIDSRSAESFAARANLLNEQAARYVQMGVDIVAVIEWIKDQEDKLAIDRAKKTGSFLEGFGAGVRQMQREVKTIGELGAEAAETIRDGLADAFTDAILDAKNLGDALKELGRSLARMMLHATMQQTVTGVMGAFAASARGNVFDSSGLVPFARGGVVDRPTVFPFARGVGLMGEAGPEAIMPLQRDSRGRLGVSGGGMDTSRIEALLTTLIDVQNRVANQKMVLVDRRSGVTKDQVAGVIIDDLEHGGPISTRIGMGT